MGPAVLQLVTLFLQVDVLSTSGALVSGVINHYSRLTINFYTELFQKHLVRMASTIAESWPTIHTSACTKIKTLAALDLS